jgi:SAM-dependent methyltransferase
VAWYRRALERSDYAEKVLAVLAPLLAGCETALDVGAGCGALALPLAERLGRVTAIEPAPAMAGALREEARARKLENIEVIEAAWGEVPIRPHDVVLCAHVGELAQAGSAFPRQASALARRGVALVRDTEEGRDKFFFSELYPIFLGRPYTPGCNYEETLEDLGRVGISPTITLVSYSSDQPFTDLEEACDFWTDYLGLEGADVRRFLRQFLQGRLLLDGAGLVAPYEKRAAVIWWRV